MSASLSVGQGSLLLNISAPLESDGVTLRDDVIGTKVWVSTLANFDPANNEGTLVYEGNSLIVSIPGLTPGTTYYVKYAILSEIDPTVYTVSTTYSGIPRGEAQVVDISGYTNFVQSVAGTFTPANADIVGTTSNIINPQFTWAITGGTLSANTGQSVTVTPASGSSGIVITLTVNGSNVITPISKTIRLSVVYDGQTGQTGSAGSKVAYPSIYKWTTDATPPARPSAATPALKYTWATADIGTPTGWASAAPSNDTPGSYLWQITIPLSAAGSVTESDLLWNSESYPIRAIGYNGANGAKGDKGATGDTGGPGAKGDTGSPGSASFVIDRGASATDTEPTAQEVLDAIGRAPVAGDMAIVSYSNYSGAKNYRYTTSWVLFNTYIPGSLIVENTITGDRLVANTVTATKIDSRGLSIKDASGNIILSAGVPLDASNITAASEWLNGNISISSDGTLNNAGGGKVTIGGLGYSGDLNATYGAQAGVNLKDSTGAALGDDSVKSNLINLDWWKRGAVIPWSQNAEYNEILSIAPVNADLVGLGPRGGNDLVWYCVENAGDGQSGGGWNANISSTLNPAKTYRFVVPIRISGTQTNGYAYWGTNGVCNLNTTTENTNPYFAVADRTVLANDRWYLFVGYVFPYGSTNNTNDSAGIWDCKTGLKVQGGSNYCHTEAGVTGHRAYQYYAAAGSKQLFGRPMINVVDGTEPSLREYFESAALLNNSITIDSSGALQGVGTGAGTVVSNAKVNVDANGKLQGIGDGAGTVVSNAKVNVDANGKLQGIGDGAGTVVSNAKVTVDANGILQGTGTADIVVNNQKVNVDTDGKLQGIGDGAGTVVSNAKVIVDANGVIQGIGTGAGSTVNNASIGLILNANGTLTATGGPVASGGITASGLGALSKSSADILSSTISINAVTGAGFRAGDLQWNAAGVRTSGKGVAMTPGGLLGVNADGVTTFAIDATTGEASFAGSTAVGQIATVATEVATNWKEKNITGIGSNYTWYDVAYTYYGTTKVAILIGKVTSGPDTYSTMFRTIDPGSNILANWSTVTPPSILTWSTWINVTVSCAGNEFIIAGWEPVSGTTDYRLKVLKGVMASLNSVTWSPVVTLGGDTPYGNVSVVWPKPVWIGSGKWIVQHVTNFYISTDNGSTWAGVTNTGSSTLTAKGPVAYNSATNTIAYVELFGTNFQSGTIGSGTTINWNASVATGSSIPGYFVGDCVWTGTRYLTNEGKNLKYSSDGINWTTITISRSLRKIRPVTSSIILGVSDSDGGLLRSSDGGLTWVDYSPSIGASAGVSLLGVVADSTNSIVVGNKNILFVDVSEQVPSGQGTVVDKAGKFYTGNSTSNIYFDGSALNLQVPFLQSKNIINTDISTKEYYNAITAGPVNVYGSITVPTGSTLTIV